MSMARRSLSPRDAMDRWLGVQRRDKTDETVASYHYRLKLFVEWCGRKGIDDLGDLDGWLLEQYIADRQAQDIAITTLKNETTTLRNFLEYCEDIDVLEEGLSETITVPDVPAEAESSNVKLDAADAERLLSYFRSDASVYGSRPHALLELLWHTGARAGGIVALDLEDRQQTEDGREYLLFRNRPESGTRLKKGPAGERPVLISGTVSAVLDHYVEHYREAVTDEYGREPLLAGQRGRPEPGTIRSWCYRATVPCWAIDCPHEKRRETCEWTTQQQASKCPSSRSPHQVRTGAMTWMRNRGLAAETVAERCNASVETIGKHYDKADPVEKMLERRAQATQDLDISDTQEDTQ